jgi:hypothetical protein
MSDRMIAAEELRLGRDLIVEPRCTIGGIQGKAERVVISDSVFIGTDTRIMRFLLPRMKFYPHERLQHGDLVERFTELIPNLNGI